VDSAILANEALKPPPLERAQIIDALRSSLDPAEQNTIDKAWLLESQDRLAAFRAGQLTAIDGEEALRAIEDELRPIAKTELAEQSCLS
jgi:Putative addiction module component